MVNIVVVLHSLSDYYNSKQKIVITNFKFDQKYNQAILRKLPVLFVTDNLVFYKFFLVHRIEVGPLKKKIWVDIGSKMISY